MATGYGLDSRGSIRGRGNILFCTPQHSDPPIWWVPGALSRGVKRPRRKAYNSLPSSAEVKNGGTISPLPHMSSWHGAYLIKHMDNFFFSLALQPNPGLGPLHETFRFTSVTRSRTVGRTPWTGDQLVARPLHIHKHRKRTHNTNTKHPCLEWDSNPRSRRPICYRDRPGTTLPYIYSVMSTRKVVT
jgi:hypothetical protein